MAAYELHCTGRLVGHPTAGRSPALPLPSLSGWHAGCSRPSARRRLEVHGAITRKTKEERLAKLESALQRSTAAFGVRYNKVKVVDFEGFRRSLPTGAELIVSKNTLLRLATERVGGWEGLTEGLERENAWVFAEEEAVAASMKAYLAFEKKLLEPLPAPERKKAKLTDLTAGVLDRQTLTQQELRQMDKLPTKAELMQKLAIMINKIPTRLAIVIKQIPTRVAVGVSKLAEAEGGEQGEPGEKTVGEVFPRPAAAGA